MKRCRVCAAALKQILNFGDQPVTNRFLKQADEPSFAHALSIAVCGRCGVVQLTDVPPVEEIRPRFDWITYNEPEPHLDSLVEAVIEAKALDSSSIVGALTYKDDSTLRRFEKKGITRTWRLDPRAIGVTESLAGIETIQQRLTPEAARSASQSNPRCDLFLVRHVLEHAADPIAFVKSVSLFVKPDGWLLFEIPDCERAIETNDCSMVWEEHLTYFTEPTFRNACKTLGVQADFFHRYPYAMEDSLVAAGPVAAVGASDMSAGAVRREHERFEKFIAGLPSRQQTLRSFLVSSRQSGKRVALLGAGHLTAMFVSLTGLAEFFDFVVDDNPNKKGLRMPGSRLPIVGSSELTARGVALCLMGVSPTSEVNVIANNATYTAGGGEFASIFPSSTRAVDKRFS